MGSFGLGRAFPGDEGLFWLGWELLPGACEPDIEEDWEEEDEDWEDEEWEEDDEDIEEWEDEEEEWEEDEEGPWS